MQETINTTETVPFLLLFLATDIQIMFTGYGVSDFCEDNNLPFALGHTPSMKAIHGGKATYDTIDSYKIALLLRGGTMTHISNSENNLPLSRSCNYRDDLFP